MRARIEDAAGFAAVAAWLQAARARDRQLSDDVGSAALTVPRQVLATAVRYALQRLVELAPGKSVEVRVPPFGAVQCVEGPGHTRGTPPNVVEMDAQTWLQLATGEVAWDAVRGSASVQASGVRADLGGLLPVFTASELQRMR